MPIWVKLSLYNHPFGFLPSILGRPFLLSEEGIVFPLTGPFIELQTLILKPLGGRSLTRF